jgi:hypothetical protein
MVTENQQMPSAPLTAQVVQLNERPPNISISSEVTSEAVRQSVQLRQLVERGLTTGWFWLMTPSQFHDPHTTPPFHLNRILNTIGIHAVCFSSWRHNHTRWIVRMLRSKVKLRESTAILFYTKS